MLEVNVQKKLGSFSINVAFLVQAPGITALFGPSGAGKTSEVLPVFGTSEVWVGITPASFEYAGIGGTAETQPGLGVIRHTANPRHIAQRLSRVGK